MYGEARWNLYDVYSIIHHFWLGYWRLTSQHWCGSAVEGFYCSLSFHSSWFGIAIMIPPHKCANVGRVLRGQGAIEICLFICCSPWPSRISSLSDAFLDLSPHFYGLVTASKLCLCIAQSQRYTALLLYWNNSYGRTISFSVLVSHVLLLFSCFGNSIFLN